MFGQEGIPVSSTFVMTLLFRVPSRICSRHIDRHRYAPGQKKCHQFREQVEQAGCGTEGMFDIGLSGKIAQYYVEVLSRSRLCDRAKGYYFMDDFKQPPSIFLVSDVVSQFCVHGSAGTWIFSLWTC